MYDNEATNENMQHNRKLSISTTENQFDEFLQAVTDQHMLNVDQQI